MMSRVNQSAKKKSTSPDRPRTPGKNDTAKPRLNTPSKFDPNKNSASGNKSNGGVRRGSSRNSISPQKSDTKRTSPPASKKPTESDMMRMKRNIPDYHPPTRIDGVTIGKDRKLREVNKHKIFREVVTNLFETKIEPAKLLHFLETRCKQRKDMFDYDYSHDTNVMNLRFCIYLLSEELETLINNLDESQGHKYIHSFDAKLNKRNEMINFLLREKGVTIKLFTKMLSVFQNCYADVTDMLNLIEVVPEFKDKNRFISKMKVLTKELELVDDFKGYAKTYFTEKDLANLTSVQKEVQNPLTREQYMRLTDYIPVFDKLDRYSMLMEEYKTLSQDMAMKEENYLRLLKKYDQLLKDFTDLTNAGTNQILNPLGPDDYDQIFIKYRQIKADERKEQEEKQAKEKAARRAMFAVTKKDKKKKKPQKNKNVSTDEDDEEYKTNSKSPSKKNKEKKGSSFKRRNKRQDDTGYSDEEDSEGSPNFGGGERKVAQMTRDPSTGDLVKRQNSDVSSSSKKQNIKQGDKSNNNGSFDPSNVSANINSFNKSPPGIAEVDLSKISRDNTQNNPKPVVIPPLNTTKAANASNNKFSANSNLSSGLFYPGNEPAKDANILQKNQPLKTKGETQKEVLSQPQQPLNPPFNFENRPSVVAQTNTINLGKEPELRSSINQVNKEVALNSDSKSKMNTASPVQDQLKHQNQVQHTNSTPNASSQQPQVKTEPILSSPSQILKPEPLNPVQSSPIKHEPSSQPPASLVKQDQPKTSPQVPRVELPPIHASQPIESPSLRPEANSSIPPPPPGLLASLTGKGNTS